MQKPNFVSGQSSTCDLGSHREGGAGWSYVRYGKRIVTAGMPYGGRADLALTSFEEWCFEHGYEPLIFGCEEQDLTLLDGWEVTEIGRQPLFQASLEFSPDLSGPDQPARHRALRKQARRAHSKGFIVRELSVSELWSLSNSPLLKQMLLQRWSKRRLAEFSFLVEFHLEKGVEDKRAFAAYSRRNGKLVGLAVITPSQRGWLLEHQMLDAAAPNGTAELLLCTILSEHLSPGTWLSLGVTPLFRELEPSAEQGTVPGILSFLPSQVASAFLKMWEPLYGFRSLLNHRQRLKPDSWEPVYWAVPRRRTLSDLRLVLKAFAGGSFARFGLATLEKQLQLLSLRLARSVFPAVNLFYILTLLLWAPILWNLDGVQLFGNPLACKVWAVYDVILFSLFVVNQQAVRRVRAGLTTDLLLGMVAADTILAWIQTALYHGGLPANQPFLAMLLFVINTAPVSAIIYLVLFKTASKPLPFLRRELPVA